MFDFLKIFLLSYQLKMLGLFPLEWKSLQKYILKIWINLHLTRKKYSREKNVPFINKTIKSVFIKRSPMKNNYLKNSSDNHKGAYNK